MKGSGYVFPVRNQKIDQWISGLDREYFEMYALGFYMWKFVDEEDSIDNNPYIV